jgi:hypothetical protein
VQAIGMNRERSRVKGRKSARERDAGEHSTARLNSEAAAGD